MRSTRLAGALLVAGLAVARAGQYGPRAGCPASQPMPRVLLASTDTTPAIRVSGLDRSALQHAIRTTTVRVADADTTYPAIAGTFTADGGDLVFQPTYPLRAGMRYRVRLRLSPTHCATQARELAWDTVVELPDRIRSPGTTVTAVYPTAAVLPMNLLKVYVHFSAPMRVGDAVDALRLIDLDGDSIIPDAFFRLEDELWDPGQTRLTVLFDPARIKRGLTPNQQMGLPLREGGRYRLEIDSMWMDATDRPLLKAFSKEFRVGGPDRAAPRIAEWSIEAPRALTRDPVRLHLREPMEHALLNRMIEVRTGTGRLVAGELNVEDGERTIVFTPLEVWRTEVYLFSIDTLLEDLAGNNMRRLFDTDLRVARTTLEQGPRATLTFLPKVRG